MEPANPIEITSPLEADLTDNNIQRLLLEAENRLRTQKPVSVATNSEVPSPRYVFSEYRFQLGACLHNLLFYPVDLVLGTISLTRKSYLIIGFLNYLMVAYSNHTSVKMTL